MTLLYFVIISLRQTNKEDNGNVSLNCIKLLMLKDRLQFPFGTREKHENNDENDKRADDYFLSLF